MTVLFWVFEPSSDGRSHTLLKIRSFEPLHGRSTVHRTFNYFCRVGRDLVNNIFGPFLKLAFNRFEAVKRIQQLERGFTTSHGAVCKLLRLFERKSDSVYCNSRLICHLELDG